MCGAAHCRLPAEHAGIPQTPGQQLYPLQPTCMVYSRSFLCSIITAALPGVPSGACREGATHAAEALPLSLSSSAGQGPSLTIAGAMTA